MIRSGAWALAILSLLLLFQSTVMNYLVIGNLKINLLWIVFIVLATQNGSYVSQIVGFILGLQVDFITIEPLGYHAFLFALAGYLFGLGKGKVYIDPVVVPALIGLLATVYTLVVEILLRVIFQVGEPIGNLFQLGLLFQLAVNIFLTPIAFWVTTWIKARVQNPRRGFGG